jgi:hypothetical protein
MTTSGQARKPRQQPAAEADTTPSGGPPAGGAAVGGMADTDPQASAGVVPVSPHGQGTDAATAEGTVEADAQPAAEEGPVDGAELRQEIERTREQLGETVEQLAAKTDVKGRARAKATELAGRARRTAAQARTQAATQVSTVRGQLAGKSTGGRQKATAVGGTVKSQLQAKAAPVREATPEPVRRAVAKGASTAQQRRVPVAMAAVTLIAGYLVFRWWRKR